MPRPIPLEAPVTSMARPASCAAALSVMASDPVSRATRAVESNGHGGLTPILTFPVGYAHAIPIHGPPRPSDVRTGHECVRRDGGRHHSPLIVERSGGQDLDPRARLDMRRDVVAR